MRDCLRVNGEGMGHATRFPSSSSPTCSRDREGPRRCLRSGVSVSERDLRGCEPGLRPSFAMDQEDPARWASFTGTLSARRQPPANVREWISTIDKWKPEVAVSDPEPLTGNYARFFRHPAGLRRQHSHDRPCRRHDREITAGAVEDVQLARAVTGIVPHVGDSA